MGFCRARAGYRGTFERHPARAAFVSGRHLWTVLNRLSQIGLVKRCYWLHAREPGGTGADADAAIDVGGHFGRTARRRDRPVDRRSAIRARCILRTTPNLLKGITGLSFGGTFRRTWWWFRRNDLLAGPLTALTATADDGSFVTIPAQLRPPTCSAAVTTELPADGRRHPLESSTTVAAWACVGNIGLLSVRNGALEPQPPGTFLDIDTTQNGYEAYMNDAWRLTSNLTLSVGANYQVYGSPSEKENRYAYLVDTATNEILGVDAYLDRARTRPMAACPSIRTLGYLAALGLGCDHFYDTDYSNFGPRVAVAWSPSSRRASASGFSATHRVCCVAGTRLLRPPEQREPWQLADGCRVWPDLERSTPALQSWSDRLVRTARRRRPIRPPVSGWASMVRCRHLRRRR